MAMIPVSHVTEKDGDIVFPWIVRCQKCGKAVDRISQAELTAMVTTEAIDPIICFDCEGKQMVDKDLNITEPVLPQNKRSPWPTISVPGSFLGFI